MKVKNTDFKEKTIVERFESLLKTSHTLDDVVGFISVENAKTLTQNVSEGMANECLEFLDYFQNMFPEESGIYDKMETNWPFGLPRVFQIALAREEELRERHKKECDSIRLSDLQYKQATQLKDYIFKMREGRIISCFTDDWEESLHIAQTIRKRDLKEYQEILSDMIKYAMKNVGIIIFCHQAKQETSIHINAFTFEDGMIHAVDAKELKRCMETQPDGSIVTFPEEIYEKAPIIFTMQAKEQ